MATDLYQLAIPLFVRNLRNLAAILKKAEAYATAQGIDPATLLAGRLATDMYPLIYQVQRVSDTARLAVVRLGDIADEPMADTEASFADLHTRIERTLAFLDRVEPDAIAGQEDRDVVLQTGSGEFPFKGLSYVQTFAHPNFYFHLTIAYAILRMQGVPLGKLDFLGGI